MGYFSQRCVDIWLLFRDVIFIHWICVGHHDTFFAKFSTCFEKDWFFAQKYVNFSTFIQICYVFLYLHKTSSSVCVCVVPGRINFDGNWFLFLDCISWKKFFKESFLYIYFCENFSRIKVIIIEHAVGSCWSIIYQSHWVDSFFAQRSFAYALH